MDCQATVVRSLRPDGQVPSTLLLSTMHQAVFCNAAIQALRIVENV
jgi:predicted hotdog family 3-hydroxylacyl-ACP dehydratase